MNLNPKLFIASGIFHPESGGPATYLYEILPHLQGRGWDVRVLTYGGASDGGYPYPVTRIARRALPLRVARYALAARPLLAWADVVYLHTLGLPLFGDRRAPRVVKIVGDQAWERAVRRGWIAPTEDIDAFQTRRYSAVVNLQKTLRAREVQSMDGVIVPSEYLKRMVVGWGVDAAKVRVIYNALPESSPHPQPLARPEERGERILSVGGEGLRQAPLLLTAARLLPWKGVDHLLMALCAVPDAQLVVAGEGLMLGAWQALAESLGVAARVRFLGSLPRDQVALLMRAADYTVLYSGYEGLSHTLLESLRLGTPVIASDKGGNPEVVQHRVNGLLVPYIDADALAAALVEALRPGVRESLAANCHVGMERFGFARMVEQTAAVLEEFAGLRTADWI